MSDYDYEHEAAAPVCADSPHHSTAHQTGPRLPQGPDCSNTMSCKGTASLVAVAAVAAATGAAVWACGLWSTAGSGSGQRPQQKRLKGYVLTLQELAAYDGQDSSKPTLVAIRGLVCLARPGSSGQLFDVSSRPDMYGRDGAYPFAGKEIARALAKMSVNPEDAHGDLTGLTEEELGVLADWEEKFNSKYEIVGKVKSA